MGRVYLARDRWLGRMVALKQAHDDALARQLAREVRVTAGLEHPGIITVYDEGRDEDGQLFYTMRLMRGRPLSQLLAEQPTGERLALLDRHGIGRYAVGVQGPAVRLHASKLDELGRLAMDAAAEIGELVLRGR